MITLCEKLQFDLSVAHPEISADQMVGLKLKVNDQSWSRLWEVSCTPLVNRTKRKDEGNIFHKTEKKQSLLFHNIFRSSVQFSRSFMSNSLWPHELQHTLSFTNSQNLLKLMSIESVMPSSHLTLCHPLLLPPSIFPSIRVFSKE